MRSRPSKKNRRPARNWREGSLPVNPCDDFAAQVLKRRHFGDELLLEMLKGWSDF